MRSNKKFQETVKELMNLADVSQRELVRRGSRHVDRPLTMGAVNPVLRGDADPSIGVMEFIAAALLVEPETFAEYRMWQARRLFDPTDEEVGFDTALKNLQALEAVGEQADLPLAPGLVAGRRGGKGNGQGKASPS